MLADELLRQRVQMLEEQLRREREERERERTTVEDLRKRLDKADGHIRALKAPEIAKSAQEVPTTVPVVAKPPKRPMGLLARLLGRSGWVLFTG